MKVNDLLKEMNNIVFGGGRLAKASSIVNKMIILTIPITIIARLKIEDHFHVSSISLTICVFLIFLIISGFLKRLLDKSKFFKPVFLTKRLN